MSHAECPNDMICADDAWWYIPHGTEEGHLTWVAPSPYVASFYLSRFYRVVL